MKKFFILILSILSISLNLVGCNNETEEQQETKEQVQIEQQETEEQEIEQQVETEEQDIDKAYELILPIVEKSFATQTYKFEKQSDNVLTLTMHLSRQDYESADYSTYNEFVDTIVDTTESGKNLLETYGYNNISFGIAVGDLTNENGDYYIIATNGQLLLDMKQVK